jgi:type II secretory pathway predicted ATPase ExeA
MDWLTRGIDPVVGSGMCMVLMGLLALSVRKRRLAVGDSRENFRIPANLATRTAPAKQLRRDTPRLAGSTSTAGSARVAEPQGAPNVEARAEWPEMRKPLFPAALDLPALPLNGREEIRSSARVSLERASLEDEVVVRPAKSEALPVDSFLQTREETPTKATVAQELAKLEEAASGEIAIAADPHTQQETAPLQPAAAGERGSEDFAHVPHDPVMVVGGENARSSDVLEFHGLKRQPFDVTPDPAFLFGSPSHREAFASLMQGIEHFRGFMMLVSEPGMGKTTLLHKMMEDLSDSARVVFLFQTQCNSTELLRFILNELEVDHAGMDVVAMHRALNQALLEEMLRGRRFVLIVDEAQNLEEPVLETIRLLSDFETTHSKLIQIVLAGQPQLAELLLRPGLVQLRQRVAVLSSLEALGPKETAEYIEHRLREAGSSGQPIFTSEAVARIAEWSGGVPRNINNLCFSALLVAAHRGQATICDEIIMEAASKLNFGALAQRPQVHAAERQLPESGDRTNSAPVARALTASLAEDAAPGTSVLTTEQVQPKHGFTMTGTLTEKIRSQSWDRKHEYRIQVTFERDPFSGLPIADRYYCCSFYISEEQAAPLRTGKPLRIKVEQD